MRGPERSGSRRSASLQDRGFIEPLSYGNDFFKVAGDSDGEPQMSSKDLLAGTRSLS